MAFQVKLTQKTQAGGSNPVVATRNLIDNLGGDKARFDNDVLMEGDVTIGDASSDNILILSSNIESGNALSWTCKGSEISSLKFKGENTQSLLNIDTSNNRVDIPTLNIDTIGCELQINGDPGDANTVLQKNDDNSVLEYGKVTNAHLENNSITLGGVSIELGGNDPTPEFYLAEATGYPTTSLTGTITNAQLEGSIANDKLVNNSVSLGGVSIALGSNDPTPEFYLAEATGYPTTSLTGTIKNAQLEGSIANDKLAGGIENGKLAGGIENDKLAGGIANDKLVNSSITLGGVSIALGSNDPTPELYLAEATGYPTSSLTGTITNAQLEGPIPLTKGGTGGSNTIQALTKSDATTVDELKEHLNLLIDQLSIAFANINSD